MKQLAVPPYQPTHPSAQFGNLTAQQPGGLFMLSPEQPHALVVGALLPLHDGEELLALFAQEICRRARRYLLSRRRHRGVMR